MSLFLPENASQGGISQPQSSQITPGDAETTTEDVKLMQRILQAAAQNPNLIPDEFMAYVFDWIQTGRLQIPIGQVFGYQRIAPQVITDFAQVPSPVDGQIILLKVGSASPFIYVQMMYDHSLGKWVSEEFSAGGGAWATTQTSLGPVAGMAGISWAPVHHAGLTMQLKWSGYLENEAQVPHAGIYLVFGNLTSSFTTASMSDATVAHDSANHPTGVDWASVSDPGDYNEVAIGMYAYQAAVGGTTNGAAAVVGRFLK